MVEKGGGSGGGVINLAGGKSLTSFAIDKGSSQHKPSKKPTQKRIQKNFLSLLVLYKK